MSDREGPRAIWSGRVWLWAVVWALGLSAAWALLAWGRPAVPIPGEAAPQFWLFWSPVTVAAILGFLAVAGSEHRQGVVYGVAATLPMLIAGLIAITAWGRSGDAAVLSSLHLPIVSTVCLGLALTWGTADPARERFAALTKALEVLVAAGILFALLGMAGGLTVGIFGVLGVTLPRGLVQTGANLAFGVIPVLALAAAYDPNATPAEQDLSRGPLRWLRLFARLAMVPVLVILAIYVLWFIPLFFWRAFQERAVLLVYNLTVVAVFGLLALVLPSEDESATLPEVLLRWIRRSILATSTATFLLNLYALAANADRVIRLGLTANRHAVLGWNLVTLLMLGLVLLGQMRQKQSSDWPDVFRRSFAAGLPVAAVWSLWVALASPLLW